jgi:hypothetical protein
VDTVHACVMELSPKPRRQCLYLAKPDLNACDFRKQKGNGERFRAMSSLIEKCRALPRKKPARENEMLAEKFDSFATLSCRRPRAPAAVLFVRVVEITAGGWGVFGYA